MQRFRFLFIMLATVLTLISTGLGAEEPRQSKRTTAREAMQRQYEQEVNEAAEQVFQIAHEALKANSSFYPFGFIVRQNDATELVTYDGDPAKVPEVSVWLDQLFVHLVKEARTKNSTKILVLARLHEISVDGKKIPGIWVQAEHRQVRPVVMFLPFITNESGKQQAAPEQLIYYATDQSFFGRDISQ